MNRGVSLQGLGPLPESAWVRLATVREPTLREPFFGLTTPVREEAEEWLRGEVLGAPPPSKAPRSAAPKRPGRARKTSAPPLQGEPVLQPGSKLPPGFPMVAHTEGRYDYTEVRGRFLLVDTRRGLVLPGAYTRVRDALVAVRRMNKAEQSTDALLRS